MTILDPTCGSGAFLFAAMNILEPLYEKCINRMDNYCRDSHGKRYKFFEDELYKVESEHHPNRQYFIFKSIILNNLYGVDIMNEAVETAKLRLFLKLVAAVDPQTAKQNMGLEPLPDIDFNIKSGNTLVGYANKEEVEEALADSFDGMAMNADVNEKSELLAKATQRFKDKQLNDNEELITFKEAKRELIEKQIQLNEILNKRLFGQYSAKRYDQWLSTHQPFHWIAEYYEIIANRGGFDVIIGNPPYLEFKQVSYEVSNYVTINSKAIHALCIERSKKLINCRGNFGMIVPLSIVSTQRMKPLQEIINANQTAYYSNFSWRPGKLFETVNRALTIFLGICGDQKIYTTNYIRWSSANRKDLFERFSYTYINECNYKSYWIPKFNSNIENNILSKILSSNYKVAFCTSKTQNYVYYRTTGGLYWKVFTNFSPEFSAEGISGHSSRETNITLNSNEIVYSIIASLSSNVFWWWYTITSNLRDLNPSDIFNFPIHKSILNFKEIQAAGEKYIVSLKDNSSILRRVQKQTGITETQSFKIQLSKPIIDEIDKLLAQHYGFTEEELDYIINYDIKYRMGSDTEDDE